MIKSTLRALRGSLVSGLLAFTGMAALAAATYSPEERKFVDKLPALFQAKCVEGVMKASQKDSPEQRAATAPMMGAMTGPDGACACVSAEVMRHITPDVLHRPDFGARMNGFATDAGSVCMARMIRTAFPAACPEMMRKQLAGRGTDIDATGYIPGLCQCVQRRMDALTPADLKPYMQALMTRSNADRDDRELALQNLPASLETDIRECGVAAANKMIDAETQASRAATADAAASQASAAP